RPSFIAISARRPASAREALGQRPQSWVYTHAECNPTHLGAIGSLPGIEVFCWSWRGQVRQVNSHKTEDRCPQNLQRKWFRPFWLRSSERAPPERNRPELQLSPDPTRGCPRCRRGCSTGSRESNRSYEPSDHRHKRSVCPS